jgi:hypothetical protein
VTQSSGEGAPCDVAIHSSREGINGDKKRHKKYLQATTTMTEHDNVEVGGSGVRHILTAACIDKRQARLPTDHFKRLLKEASPNHAYPVRHKLKDRDMMRSSMTTGSLTWGVEFDKNSNGSDTTLFPKEDAVMTVYGGRPPSRRRRMSNLSPRAPTRCCSEGQKKKENRKATGRTT